MTSCRPGEGKTTAAVTIAHALAASASGKVLLVDANRAAPRLDRLFEVNRTPGLIDYLSSDGAEEALTAALRESGVDGLVVMPHGGGRPEAGGSEAEGRAPGLFGRRHGGGAGANLDPESFAAKLAALKSRFAYVVFDGDSVLASSHASLVAGHFDGVVFVVECEKTKWEVLRLAQEKIANVGGSPLGVVLNKRRYYIPRGLYGKV